MIQGYYKGKQESSTIPAYHTHPSGKWDATAFHFHFPFSLDAALSSVNSQHRKASALSRMTRSLSINIHNTSSWKLLSPLTLTQVPLKLRCMNPSVQRKLTENKRLFATLIHNFWFSISAEKYQQNLWNLFNLQKVRANWTLNCVNYHVQRNNSCRNLQLYWPQAPTSNPSTPCPYWTVRSCLEAPANPSTSLWNYKKSV